MAGSKMRWYDWFAYILITIGAINWGLYGGSRLINKSFDLVTWLGQTIHAPVISNILFLIVGLIGLYGIVTGIKLALK